MRILKASASAALIAFAVSGCKAKPPTFHFTFADPCADVSIVGTMQGREYALGTPPDAGLAACYGLENSRDVGKDVSAVIDPAAGEIKLTLDGEKQAFEIEAAREAK